uniref:Uncharacterized protein n=1 Tax=viral metagenome TaxID=1070528 RepID=A0A6C0CH03_9ZZZZ
MNKRVEISDDTFSEELQTFGLLREFIPNKDERNKIKTSELKAEFIDWVESIPEDEWDEEEFNENLVFYLTHFFEYKYGYPDE